jgi:hypothetical protein
MVTKMFIVVFDLREYRPGMKGDYFLVAGTIISLFAKSKKAPIIGARPFHLLMPLFGSTRC